MVEHLSYKQRVIGSSPFVLMWCIYVFTGKPGFSTWQNTESQNRMVVVCPTNSLL